MYLLNDRDDMQKAAAQINTISILAGILVSTNELASTYPAHSVLVREVTCFFFFFFKINFTEDIYIINDE